MISSDANTAVIEVGPLKISFPLDLQIEDKPPAELTQIPSIGEYWDGQGGVYVGFVRGPVTSRGWHLILPVDPSARAKDLTWGPYGTDVLEAAHPSDGLANTEALIGCAGNYPAAEFTRQVSVDGHKDFYLPARRELALIEMNVPELVEKGWWWSSTQYSARSAYLQTFSNGLTDGWLKGSKAGALAVRRLIIQ